MTDIINSKLHTDTGLVVNSFGENGAQLTPIHGEQPGKSFILDADSVDQLIAALQEIKGGQSA